MIEFKTITKDNFQQIINMKMPEDQHFVAPNVYSLAQAWLFPDQARPFAIYDGEELVGFIMLDYDVPKREAGIWRLMIALEHQGKGYGTAAVAEAIRRIRAENQFDAVFLDYAPDNVVAKHVYEKAGFVATGDVEYGEIVMKLELA